MSYVLLLSVNHHICRLFLLLLLWTELISTLLFVFLIICLYAEIAPLSYYVLSGSGPE